MIDNGTALSAEKKRLRRLGLSARESLDREIRTAYSERVSFSLLAHPDVQSAQTILAYRALPGELDVALFCERAQHEGKTVAYPAVRSKTSMEAYRPDGPDDWYTDAFGIETPIASRSALIAPEELDVVIVPCVAFDAEGGRIGWGGGYYDRYLPLCTKARIIGVAFGVQQVECVPMAPWDVRLDDIITE